MRDDGDTTACLLANVFDTGDECRFANLATRIGELVCRPPTLPKCGRLATRANDRWMLEIRAINRMVIERCSYCLCGGLGGVAITSFF